MYDRIENPAEMKDLLGQIITKIEGKKGDGEIVFHLQDGRKFVMYHEQDCCEMVEVEDICGEWEDLIGLPILISEEVSNAPKLSAKYHEKYDYTDESFKWTFYKLSTNRGAVTIRWYGSSNGYYSERVDLKWGN